MKVLAIDTSCMMGSVALLDGEVVVAEQLLNVSVTHSERLMPSVEFVLTTAGVSLQDVDGFAVAIGPGSFTGLRIGLGAVKGMAFATKKPVVGISTLDALAYNAFGSEKMIVSVLDARRGEFYIGVYKFVGNKLETVLEDTVMPPEQLIDYVAKLKKDTIFVGDGICGLKDKLAKKIGASAHFPPPSMVHPRASNVAWLAMERLKKGDADDIMTLVPNYIRKSDADKNKL